MTLQEFTKLKHDLRNSANHILGYSQLIQETAIDLRDDNTATLARKVQDWGQLIVVRIEEMAARTGQPPDAGSIRALRLALLPLAEEIMQAASSGSNGPPTAGYGDDLEKICKATRHLVALVTTA